MDREKRGLLEKIKNFFWKEVEVEVEVEEFEDEELQQDTAIYDTSAVHQALNDEVRVDAVRITEEEEDPYDETFDEEELDEEENFEEEGYYDEDDFEDEDYMDEETVERTRRQKMAIAAVLIFTVFVFAFSGCLFFNQYFGEAGVPGSELALAGDGLGFFSSKDKEDNIEKLLIIGVDERPGEGSRADTIILAIINTTNPELKLLSIPRDTRLIISGRKSYDKINHAQAYGGASLLVDTVNDFLGTDVDKYVQLNFNSFKEVVDILGGVEYEVERNMYYPPEGINLKAGLQTLDGDKALQYVRFRSDGRGDVGRVERQQAFLMTFMEQKLNLRNALKVPELVGEAYKSVRTNLSVTEMVSLGMALKELEMTAVRTEMLPGDARMISGISYWVPSAQDLEAIFIEPEEPEATEEAEKTP